MNALKWLDKYFEETLLLLFLSLMVGIMGLQIVSRYVLSSSLSWSEEATRYLFVYSGFLSASYCCKNNLSIRIDQFVNILPKKLNRFMKIIAYAAEMAFFVYLFPFSIHFVNSAIVSGQKTAALGLPMWIVETTTVLCCFLCVLRLLQKIIEQVRLLIKERMEV